MVIALYGWAGYLLPESYVEQSRVARAALWSDTKPTRGTSGTHNGDVRLQYDDIMGLVGKETIDNAPCGSSGGRFGLAEGFKAAIYNDGDVVGQIS
jgi:hypothetical protein